jgi:steroid 5-alpha reductase family enzyme
LFKYISNPNYLGEIIEWIGYGIVCWKFEAFLFAFSTFNVLVPAAMVRSKWNHQNIPNYPS